MKRSPLSSRSSRAALLPIRRLRPLKIPGVTSFRVLHSPDPQPAHAARMILDDIAHVLHQATRQKVAQRDRNTLWWNITSNNLPEKKAVRAWCCRRARGALVEALKARGYDREGRVQTDVGVRTSLCGSLQLLGTEHLITVKFSELQKEAAFVVDALVNESCKVARASPESGC